MGGRVCSPGVCRLVNSGKITLLLQQLHDMEEGRQFRQGQAHSLTKQEILE